MVTDLVNQLKGTAEDYLKKVLQQTSSIVTDVKDMLVNSIPPIVQSVKDEIPGTITKVGDDIGLITSTVGNFGGMLNEATVSIKDDLHSYIDTKLAESGVAPSSGLQSSDPGASSAPPVGGGDDKFIIDECVKKVKSILFRELRKRGIRTTRRVKRLRKGRRTNRR